MGEIQDSQSNAPLPGTSRREAMVQDIIGQALARGADGVEAGVSLVSGLSVTVRLGETESLE